MKRKYKISALLVFFFLLCSFPSVSFAQQQGKSNTEEKNTTGEEEEEDKKDGESKQNEPSPSFESALNRGEALNIRSPNAYSLGKYGDIPVSYATGVPNIHIPLMTLTDKGLNLDISLSYHASGIKVDEEAPWTGLGWSLNAGGIITRVIRGNADLPNAGSNGLSRQRTSITDYQHGQNFELYRDQTLFKLQVAETNQTDNEPDIFIFNFAGYSGKFFLDDHLKPIFFEYRDFDVKYIYNPSDINAPYFTITTDDGIVYEFKEREYTYDYAEGRSNVTAWYLTKMTGPAGGEINFTYQPGGAPSRFYQKRQNDVFFIQAIENASQHSILGTINGMRPAMGSQVTSFILKEIRTSAGYKIDFLQTASSRLDAEEGRGSILNEIILKDASGNQQKKYTLHHSYFEAGNNHKVKPEWPPGMTCLNYRLKLDSLREVSQTNNSFLTHKFEYYYNPNPNTDDSYTLPYRLSPCQDHWGYYNHSHNATLFPNNPANKYFHSDDWYVRFLPEQIMPSVRSCVVTGGGTREPDMEAVKAGTLRKITYPTGGHVTFDYEPHGYNPGLLNSAGGIRIRQITNSNGEVKTYDYLGHSFISSLYLSSRTNPYYTLYYQNATDDGEGRPRLLNAFGIPDNLFNSVPFILKMDSRPQAILGAGPVMVYDRVTESMSGNGRIEYEFSYADDWNSYDWGNDLDGIPLDGIFHSGYLTSIPIPWATAGMYVSKLIGSDTWPYPDKVSTEWKRGHLTAKTVFNEAGQRVQKDEIEYDQSALRAIPGYKVVKYSEGTEYVYARSYTVGGQAKVKKEISTQFMPDGSEIKTIKEYDYSSASHKKVTEERTWDSEGKQLKTKYYYPTEYASSLFTALKNKNILSPVDIRVYRDNKLVSGTQFQSDDTGNPLVVYKAELTSGVQDIPFNPSNPFTFKPHTTLTYYPSGLLSSHQSNSEIPVVYLWSYSYQYPVIEVKGASFNEVKAALNYTSDAQFDSFASLQLPTSQQINAMGASIRSYFGSSRPVQVTTYTYQPLVNITSVTNPANVAVYYDYDGFGRLKTIRDKDNHVIESYEYNYKK